MKAFFKNISSIIPSEKKKRLPFFFFISIINSLLDFISIAFLTPFILLILDKEKANELLSHFGIEFNTDYLIYALGCLIIFYILKNLLQARIVFRQSKYLYAIGTSLSQNLISSFIYGKSAFYFNADKGKLIRDFHRLPIIFITNILLPVYHIISEVIILMLIIMVSLFLNPLITGISIFFVLIFSIILAYLRKNKTKKINRIISNSYQDALNRLMNVLNGYIEIKGSKSEKHFIEKFQTANKSHNEMIADLTTIKQNSIRFLEIFTVFLISLFLIFLLVSSWDLRDIVLLSFFGSAILKIIPSFNKLINSYVDIKSNIHALTILTTYNLETKDKHSHYSFERSLTLKGIKFNYPDNESIIDNISLSIIKGDFTVITGVSGSGKTTLLHIISGLIQPISGNILIDEKPANSKTILPFVYILSQQSFIFQGTLLENIVMGNDKKVDKKYILELLNVLGLKEWFNTLSNGLNTVLNLDSKAISGGQKQRIALLRALYSKPSILLMDEAVNQLNDELKSKTLSFLKKKTNSGELTIVAVFHNKEAIKYATKHYTLSNKILSPK